MDSENKKVPIVDGFFGTLIASVGGALVLIFFIELIKYLQRANKKPAKRVTEKGNNINYNSIVIFIQKNKMNGVISKNKY
ncbi:MAG: hypothetical protein R2771_03970 [Saprospiraceae bacterium]